MRRETSGLNVCNPELFGRPKSSNQKKNWWKFFWKIAFFLWAIYFRNISFIYNKKKLFFITQIFDNFFPGLNSGILFVQTNKQKTKPNKTVKTSFFHANNFFAPLTRQCLFKHADDNWRQQQLGTNKQTFGTNTHTHTRHNRFWFEMKKKIRFNDTMVMLEQQQKTIIQNQNFILISLLSTIFFSLLQWMKKKRGVNYSFFHRVFVNVIIWIFITHKQTNNHNNDRMEKTLSPVCLAVRKVFICSTQWWQQIQQIFTSNTIEW